MFETQKICRLGALALLTIAPCTLWAAGDRDEDIRAMRRMIANLQAQVDQLKADRSAAPAANVGAPEKRVIAKMVREELKLSEEAKNKAYPHDFRVYWKEGIRLDSLDKAFKLKIGGRIMSDWSFTDYDSDVERYVGEQSDGHEFRRARLYVAGTIYGNVEFKAQYDFAGGDADFKDMYVGYKSIPYLGGIRAGHFKEPFGLEELTSSKYITFMERALPDAFAPSRNVGVMLHNHVFGDRVTYAVGWFRPTGAYGNGSGDGDYAATARVTALPLYANKGRQLLHLGVAATKRANNDSLRLRAHPENHQVSRLVDTGAFGSNNVQIIGLEAALVLGPFSVQSEYTRAEVDRRNSAPGMPNNASFSGYYVEASCFLTGESRHYKKKSGAFSRVKPKHNFSIKNGGFGAWQVAARYSHLDLNDQDIQGGEEDNITLGLNWHLNPNARVMFNYVIADVDRQFVGLGRDLNAKSAMVRLQVDF